MRELCYIVGPEYHNATVQTFLRRGCGVSARSLARLKRVENGITADGVHVRVWTGFCGTADNAPAATG